METVCVADREWLELAADLLAGSRLELPVERITVELARTFGTAGAVLVCDRAHGGDEVLLVADVPRPFVREHVSGVR